MTAYKKQHLNSKLVRETAREAFYDGLIDKEVYAAILQKHSYHLYTPNIFIFFGFALLTLIISLCSTVLLGLVFGADYFDTFVTLCVIMAVLCYIALELLVNTKRHYNAGIDNALMVITVMFAVAAFAIGGTENVIASAVLFVICAWLSYRFTDAFMGMLAYMCMLTLFFYSYTQTGINAMVTAPFVLAAVSAITYLGMNILNRQAISLCYRKCISYIKMVAVASFYASVNYFTVNYISENMFYPGTQAVKHLPAGWLLWACTGVIPAAYLVYGIRAKSLLFMRSGVLFMAVSIVTAHYYYPLLPAGVALMLAGGIVIVVAGFLMHRLRKPKHGFVFANDNDTRKEIKDLEAIIVAEAFKIKLVQVSESGVKFGGGSSGGGGATGNY